MRVIEEDTVEGMSNTGVNEHGDDLLTDTPVGGKTAAPTPPAEQPPTDNGIEDITPVPPTAEDIVKHKAQKR